MDFKKLNEDLLQIVKLRNKLSELDYSDKNYDDVEDDLGDFEDDFNDNYGDFLEDVLGDIHEKLCPGVDVLVPTAYLAKKYFPNEFEPDQYDIEPNEGIKVETLKESKAGLPIYARIVMLPSPARYVFTLQGDIRTVWSAEKPHDYNF